MSCLLKSASLTKIPEISSWQYRDSTDAGAATQLSDFPDFAQLDDAAVADLAVKLHTELTSLEERLARFGQYLAFVDPQ